MSMDTLFTIAGMIVVVTGAYWKLKLDINKLADTYISKEDHQKEMEKVKREIATEIEKEYITRVQHDITVKDQNQINAEMLKNFHAIDIKLTKIMTVLQIREDNNAGTGGIV